ncbi:MAG TPA: hypothetical protein VHE14_04770 [Solirubrobacteraceae bacterium]|nr:hypothetical protein [Solirubrobacteraceae bacterium]
MALEEFVGPDRAMDDDDIQIFATWFHNDRELSDGGTPAQRYAALPDLAEDERAVASRIAGARLGLHRVLAVEPGTWLVLEDIVDRARVRVRSQNVSHETVRWDIILGRVMDGDPPSLWSPTRFFEPGDEPELLAELERSAGGGEEHPREADLLLAFRSHALELMRFTPPSRRVEPSFFTLEGDRVAHGLATWEVGDPAAARERLRALGGLEPGAPLELDITVARDTLVGNRPELPPGAVVIEAGSIGDIGSVPIATLRLEGAELRAEAMSAERLERVIEIVAHDFGELAELSDREVVAIEQRLKERRSAPRGSAATPTGLTPVQERRLLGGFMTERMRKWLDEPQPQLSGRTPREAVGGEHRAELIRLFARDREQRRTRPPSRRAVRPGRLDARGARGRGGTRGLSSTACAGRPRLAGRPRGWMARPILPLSGFAACSGAADEGSAHDGRIEEQQSAAGRCPRGRPIDDAMGPDPRRANRSRPICGAF